MGTTVPLERLPAAFRATIRPGSPAWTAYAAQAEINSNLPPGTLTGAQFNLSPGVDPLSLFRSIAANTTPSAITPDATATAGALSPAGAQPSAVTPGITPPPQQINADPSAGGGTLQLGPFDTGIHTPQWLDRTLSGMGKSAADTGQGIGQILGMVTPDQVAETRRLDAPLMNTGAGLAGYIGGSVAAGALPAGAVAKGALALRAAPELMQAAPTLLRAATSLPAQAAIVGGGLSATQPVAPGESRGANAAEGAALGGGLAGAGTAVKALGSAAVASSPTAQALADKAAQQGIQLRAAQVSGNPLTQGITALADKLPFSGTQGVLDAQHSQFNRALSRTIGADTDNATQSFRDAKPRLTADYDELTKNNNLQLEPWHVDAMKDYADAYAPFAVSKAGQENLRTLQGWRQNITNATDSDGLLTGDQYKAFRSELGNAATQTDSPQMRTALKGYQQVLDKGFRSGLSPEASAKIAQTDKYWGNMKTLQGMAPKNPEEDFNFGKLAQVLGRNTKGNAANLNGSLYGTGDQTLPDLASIGVNFLNRGAAGSPAGPVDFLRRLGSAAVKPMGAAAVGGGLYALTKDDEHPGWAAAGGLGALGLAGAMLGRGVNSRWMLNGAPAMAAAGQGLARSAAPLSAGALNAWRAGLPTGDSPP